MGDNNGSVEDRLDRIGPQRALERLLRAHCGVSAADPAFRANPHPSYHHLRDEGPVLSVPDTGEWLVTGYDEALAILRDPRFSSNGAHRKWPGGAPPTEMSLFSTDRGTNVLLFLDAPDHTRIRKLVSKAFTPRTVERLRPRVTAIVDEALDAAEADGIIDVVGDLGYTVPVTVICELMGVPVADRHLFADWSSAASRLLDGFSLTADEFNRAVAGAAAVVNYFNDLFEQRRRQPADDLVSALLAAEEQGDRLSEAELRSITVLLFIAGHETTMNLIGNGTWALLTHPEQMDKLQADPSLAPSAVEELLRFDGPVHVTGRIPTEDIEIGGHQFPAGDQLTVLLAAANRDARRYANPDVLDIARADNHHLTFSQGMHYCLGAALARLEGSVTFERLATRFGGRLELDTDPVTYRDHFVLRGLQELRVRIR
jgi:cytochrome P450